MTKLRNARKKDQFSQMKEISRQERYQLRQRAAKHCILCGADQFNGTLFCEKHLLRKRRYERSRYQAVKKGNGCG